MSQLPLSPSAPASKQVVSFDLENLERTLIRSTTFALCVIVGLPSVGVLFSLVIGLPFFAALMAGIFLFATGLTCRKALAAFTGRTLRLLVTARLVLILVLAALLCCTYHGQRLDRRGQRCARLAGGGSLAGEACPLRSLETDAVLILNLALFLTQSSERGDLHVPKFAQARRQRGASRCRGAVGAGVWPAPQDG